ncbi:MULTISPECIES: hypothetical protein [Lysinibacillus]|uniref:Uncharacterized protein n=3 Tax=Lysinibacillus TaxID=400634 RepID=B1HMA0_LYSSC|nr:MULTISPECIES: hypothetical protein [Lysinibacillus]ACA38672.1 hypothetical protein Bsph_1060 [Lysinibacillus sphaericus C3-41]AMO31063.1 hypothetical protein AR327_00235 [Lysinibacillus sphaericus]AMR89830.1 hypothetical protein A1T07_06440 [Lysinibacillus sphaericus]ANA47901.1 hypothetical protein A2J09_21645 [Lysinibacillus sphaericus]EWH35088.1 hypothetical protein P799_01070 [Lysinibacillus sphaericus CBAM5]
MKSAGGKTYTVSANGNVTNDGVFQYVWNAFDQLTEVKSLSGVTVASYRYDGYPNESIFDFYYNRCHCCGYFSCSLRM